MQELTHTSSSEEMYALAGLSSHAMRSTRNFPCVSLRGEREAKFILTYLSSTARTMNTSPKMHNILLLSSLFLHKIVSPKGFLSAQRVMIVLFVHLREAQSYLYGKKRGCTNTSRALLLSNQKLRRSLVTKNNRSYTLVIAALSS
jgi:hypothetical protein